jgi:5-methylcytosine-specific restriction endonuclease McrA
MNAARDLSARLRQLLRQEQGAVADFLIALADFDRRQAWRELGHTSLFAYLHRELGLSKGAAFYKKTAAELLQAYPEVIEPMRDGRLCLSTVGELARVLTPENRDRVLPSFFHLSKREARELAAALDPVAAPPRREVVTTVRPAPAAAALALAASPAEPSDSPDEPPGPFVVQPDELAPPPPVRPPPPPPSTAEPLSEALSRLHLTVSKEFLRKLEAARDALSHSRPEASSQEILEAGLDLILQQATRRRGLVARPRKTPPPSTPDADHVTAATPAAIPAGVRREVWQRDQGRCQWPMQDGRCCGSTHRLELDHVVPRARGGPSTVANLRVLCRPHNLLAARIALGDAAMERFTRTNRPRPARRGADGRAEGAQSRA